MPDPTNKTSWLTSAAPVIGAGLDFLSGLGGSLFNMNQARKNRAFQERMYQRQYEDNLRLWHMNNAYNDPKAVLSRVENAGLNPLLMYEGGTSLTSSSAAQGANAPSGDSARANLNSNFQGGLTQAALLQAQIANINADTENKEAAAEQSRQSANNLSYDLMFKRLCQNVEYDLKVGNLRNLEESTRNLAMNTLNTSEMMVQNILTLRQAREYEIKRFNLDKDTYGSQLAQGWKHLANETEGVRQRWRELAMQWSLMKSQIGLNNAQIGTLAWNIVKDKKMFGLQFEGLRLDNKLKIWNRKLIQSDIQGKQATMFNTMLKNYYLRTQGAEQTKPYMFKEKWDFRTHEPSLIDLLTVTPITVSW